MRILFGKCFEEKYGSIKITLDWLYYFIIWTPLTNSILSARRAFWQRLSRHKRSFLISTSNGSIKIASILPFSIKILNKKSRWGTISARKMGQLSAKSQKYLTKTKYLVSRIPMLFIPSWGSFNQQGRNRKMQLLPMIVIKMMLKIKIKERKYIFSKKWEKIGYIAREKISILEIPKIFRKISAKHLYHT